MAAFRSLLQQAMLVSALAAGASAQALSIQPCTDGFAPENFVVNADQTVTQSGKCVDFDGGNNIVLAACDGSNDQKWTFETDGTVHNAGNTANCWNVDGGGVGAGNPIVMYQCDSVTTRSTTTPEVAGRAGAGVAANDIFWPLPSQTRILANESGLCVSSAAPPPPPCETTFTCCSLNGELDPVTQRCNCYSPWTGDANCSSLSFLPSKGPFSGYGMQPNLTSWGGNMFFYGGQYHMYVAEMANDCSLNEWQQNSQCVHATAPTPEGPFKRQGVAIGVFCHNPQVMHLSASESGTGADLFVLFHIGTGTGGNPKNCTPPSDSAVVSFDDAADGTGRWLSESGAGSTLHTASTPTGPWTPVNPTNYPDCNNPSPMLHPNGTWYLLCNSANMYTSSNGLMGPWSHLYDLQPAGGGVSGTYEDAFLFVDPRLNWHIIFHVYTTNVPDTCVNSTVSGHYFSPDGMTWAASPNAPYGNHVDFTDGSSMVVSTRERPKLVFDSAGTPTHLVNGVCGGTSFCAPTPCVNCKYNWWDFTLVAPLDLTPK